MKNMHLGSIVLGVTLIHSVAVAIPSTILEAATHRDIHGIIELTEQYENNQTITGLHIAACYNYEKVIEVLIDNGDAINAITDGGHTPLHLAILTNSIQAASILIKKGANFNQLNKLRKTPKMLANERKMISILKIIKQAEEWGFSY